MFNNTSVPVWLLYARPKLALLTSGGMRLMVSALLMALNQLRVVTTAPAWFLVAATLTIAASVGFVIRQGRTSDPIMNLRYFRDPDFALVNAGHVILNLAGLFLTQLLKKSKFLQANCGKIYIKLADIDTR